MMKNLLGIALIFTIISLASAAEITIDTPHHHLGIIPAVREDIAVFQFHRGLIALKDKIQILDGTTRELVWTGGKTKGDDVSIPTLYKDKLYLTSNDGKLYAFEHGEEPFAIETIHIYLVTLAILFLLIGAITYRKRSSLKDAYLEGELQKNFKFSAIIAIIIRACGLIFYCLPIFGPVRLAFATIAFGLYFDDLNLIMLLLVATIIGISIITGTLVGLRTKNKVRIGIAIGATPHIIVALSLLYVYIVAMCYYYYYGIINEFLGIILIIGWLGSLSAAVIAGILGGVFGYVLRKD
jgi:hypothetical protein